MRTILTAPNRLLRRRCQPVVDIDAGIRTLANELVELLGVEHQGKLTAGIAAPQIGELVRMFVYRPNPYSKVPSCTIVINPELIYAKGRVVVKEGCLSLPEKEFQVERHKIVKLRGLTIDGESRTFKGRDLTAETLEHELDHLDGLMIDQKGQNER